jgi:hypothetical protein
MNPLIFMAGQRIQSPEDLLYVGLFFTIYLLGVAASVAYLTVGQMDRGDWLLVFLPILYYPLIPLHGEFHDANVEVLWELTFQWTIPSAAVGFVIGRHLKRIITTNSASPDDDSNQS